MKHSIPRSPFSTQLSGSAKETEIRIRNLFQGPKKRPPFPLMFLTALLVLSCGWLVSCQPGEAASGGPDASLETVQALPAPSEASSEETGSYVRDYEDFLDGLTLDSSGEGDDAVTVRSHADPTSPDESLTTLTVHLGSGAVLERQWEECYIPSITCARLISPDRDAIVLECLISYSNYAAADYFVLEVADGELVQRYQADFNSVFGYEVIQLEGEALASLRLPCLVDKWHAPEWYTVRWTENGFSAVGDGYFTDTWPITVNDGRKLTLALRGRLEDSDVFSFPYLIYDQIQVLEGEAVLQAITPEGYLPKQYYDPSGFLADYAGDHGTDVRDINFDGADDFGLLCDTTRNGTHAWFVWDEAAGQFRYLAHLGGDLAVDSGTQQLTEVLWDQSFDHQLRNLYRYDSQGNLVLTDTRPMEQSAG